MKFVLATLASLVLATSCVTYRLQPVDPPTQNPGDLAVKATAVWAPEIQFTVKVTNKSDKTLTIDSDQFRLYVGDDDVWTSVPMTTSTEYYDRAEEESRQRATITVTSSSRPVYRTQTTSSTTVIGSNSSVTIVRTRPVVQPVETRTVTIVPRQNDRYLEWLQQNLFYSVELKPGLDYTGVVYGNIGRGNHYKLVLPVDGKEYVVIFERIKDRSGPFTNLD